MSDAKALLEKAVQKFGSQAKLATACGVKQASIWQALQTQPSAELAMKIEAATGREIRAEELRPDLPWPPVEALSA